jgi:hypothetical protein
MQVYSCARASANPPEDRFVSILPRIMRDARCAFRACDRDTREECIAEVVAYAWQSFRDLHSQGREIFPSAVAKYAIKRVGESRPFGSASTSQDLASKRCQVKRGIAKTNLGAFACDLADSAASANPAYAAMMRLDFSAWIDTLSPRERKLALALADGESTSAAARLLKLSAGRISQLRRAFQDSWRAFHAGRSGAELALAEGGAS